MELNERQETCQGITVCVCVCGAIPFFTIRGIFNVPWLAFSIRMIMKIGPAFDVLENSREIHG